MRTFNIAAALLLSLAACSHGSSQASASGSTGSGSTSGSAGSSSSGSTSGGACTPAALQHDATLNFDLAGAPPTEEVHLTGNVTVNGAPLTSSNQSRGDLHFEGRVRAKSALDAWGNYEAFLPEGTYDVTYEEWNAACGPSSVSCGDQALGTVQFTRGVQTHDFDLRGVHLRGNVTVEGQPLADATRSRGWIELVTADGGWGAAADLGATGAGSYDLFSAPGTYGVTFAARPDLCQAATSPTQVPCTGAILAPAGALTADDTLDVDLKTVHLSGAVTVNGAPLQDSQGSIELAGPVDTVKFPIVVTDGGSYSATVSPGSYALAFQPAPGSCEVASTVQSPCNAEPLGTVSLTADQVANLDVKSVSVSGAVTLDGQAMGTSTTDRGSIAFTRGESYPPLLPSLGASGPAAYSVRLAPGTYDVSYVPGTSCDPTAAVPCVGGPVMSQVAISSDTTLNLDVPAARVQGVVTQNGSSVASGAQGTFKFVPLDGGSLSFLAASDLSSTGSFVTELFKGTYEVDFAADGIDCSDVAGALPCVSEKIEGAASLGTGTQLHLDVPVAHVGGTITVNGQPLSTNQALGAVDVIPLAAGGDPNGVLAPVSAGSASYGAPVAPGSYELLYVPYDPQTGSTVPPDGVMPAVRAVLKTNVQLTGTQSLDFALKTIHVSGTITVGDAGLPQGNRGWIGFSEVADDGGLLDSQTFALPDTGPATYSVTLVPGNYAVTWDPVDCSLIASVPCSERALLGCVEEFP